MPLVLLTVRLQDNGPPWVHALGYERTVYTGVSLVFDSAEFDSWGASRDRAFAVMTKLEPKSLWLLSSSFLRTTARLGCQFVAMNTSGPDQLQSLWLFSSSCLRTTARLGFERTDHEHVMADLNRRTFGCSHRLAGGPRPALVASS